MVPGVGLDWRWRVNRATLARMAKDGEPMADLPANITVGTNPTLPIDEPPADPSDDGERISLIEPWDQHDGESDLAFAAFRAFLALGARRKIKGAIRKIRTDLADPATVLPMGVVRQYEQWSSRHQWFKRARAYDRNALAEADRAALEARIEMNERHARIATAMQRLVLRRIQRAIDDNDNSMSIADMTRLMSEASKIERLARGASTENIDQVDQRVATGDPGTELNIAKQVLRAKIERMRTLATTPAKNTDVDGWTPVEPVESSTKEPQ